MRRLVEWIGELMEKFLLLALGLSAAWPAQAQLLNRESVNGAALGGLVGGIIGHNHGRQTAEGIAIGAGSGFLLGSLLHQSRAEPYPLYSAPYVASVPVNYYPATAYTPAPAPAPPPAVIAKPIPVSPMSSANSLFGR